MNAEGNDHHLEHELTYKEINPSSNPGPEREFYALLCHINLINQYEWNLLVESVYSSLLEIFVVIVLGKN